MITKNLLYNKVIGLAVATLTFVSCTDTWDDHYESLGGGENGVHEGTIWSAIKSNPNMTNFARVIEGCDYVDRLNGSQVFTVFAPTDNDFTSAEAEALIAEYKAQAETVLPENNTVIKEFIQNHMALYNHSFTNMHIDTLVLMNGKYAVVNPDTTINGVKMTNINQLYSNGVLFTMDKKLAFEPNVFEAFRKDQDYDSIYSFLYNSHYYYKVFQPSQSVAGSIVNGKTQYLDSVFTQRNELYSYVGLINSEDSDYIMVAPTNAVWKQLIDEYQTYFDYPEKLTDRDSMAYTQARLAIVEGTTFSRTFNTDAALQDSAMSTNCIRSYTSRLSAWGGVPFEYNQYYMPKAAKGALNQTEIMKCSNGEVRKATEWNIDKRMSFHTYRIADNYDLKEVKKDYDNNSKDSIDAVSHVVDYVTADNKAFYNKVWNNSFLTFESKVATSNHWMTYTIPGVLSNIGYDIYLVYVPALAADTTATGEQRLPTKFKARLISPGLPSDGESLENKDDPYFQTKGSAYEPAPDSICYVKLANDFKFPKATVGVGDESMKTYLRIDSSVSNNELRKKSHTRTMRINCILVVPHGSLELVDQLPATVGTGSKMTKIPASAQGQPGVLLYPHGQYDDRDYKAWYMQR
jgi:uncharacterized surface protein with fasciclin (FAS1) repeats